MLLRKDDPWQRELDHPDVRNWRVIDSEDRVIGFVETVVVNRQEKRVDAILTGANERFPVEDVDVGERVIRLRSPLEVRDTKSPGRKPSGKSYEDAFREHFKEVFAASEDSYESRSHAYAFGRRMALDADYSGLRYERAREALRAHWITQRLSPPFDRVEAAVRYAFELVQGIEPYHMTGIEREGQQILGGARRGDDESERAGAHMTTGRPRSSDDDGVEPRSTA